jgi:hypothetical protein
MKFVYVINKDGQPLMPTKRQRWVRHALRDGRAKIVRHDPFAIQLLFETTNETQDITLGIDAGYKSVGFSAITEKEELIGGNLSLLEGMSERITQKSKYTGTRRSRLRHRKPGFRKDTKGKNWLAPSIQHKLDSHLRLINRIKSVLPVTKTIIETASFDTQRMKNPEIEGADYQKGDQAGFSNLREYILHRDHHKCQNPNCKGKSKILQIHHVGYWKYDRSDRPGNLITLCTHCHTSDNHQKGGFLFGWEPTMNTLRAATFMSMVHKRLALETAAEITYGYLTKLKRKELGLEKTHHNDAFVIADGKNQARITSSHLEQIRRNNRSLSTFYDAKYIDLRDGTTKSGKELCSGRRKRNKNLNGENLRLFRGKRIRKGSDRVKKQRYAIQSGDMVKYEGITYVARGVQNKGAYIRLCHAPKDKVVRMNLVTACGYRKGICCVV